ncbi:MAG: tRNA uridine-5-carboxymethylaminomethyl(34) synthesis GTPase MnmE [candidate division Zixibacteria bacterium]|nr:tRNA uridine-5-carboxymethylaminomethyl(34) synthesis GTPase MnmE [candidate division Zixibacteria bacterium]
MFRDGDTIAAVATPPGRGALAIIRVSGPATREISEKVFRAQGAAAPRVARVGDLVHPASGDVVDRAVLVLYAAPHSYTGEDMAELTTHAGPAVLEAALEALYAAGARAAEPGEFTWRAVGNDKLDLAAAQAVADLADARTAEARADALRRLAGELSDKINGLREQVLSARAQVEAALEFEQEVSAEKVLALVAAAEAGARELVASSRDRAALVEGLTVAIAGPRNAGKSTLFNRLLGEERAIVTPEPGTTTDRIDAPYITSGVLFRLSDGAGLDVDGENVVEREGVRRARAYLEEAALVIWLDDGSAPPPPAEPPVEREKLVGVINKRDLPLASGWEAILEAKDNLWLSAKTGEGVDKLAEELVRRATTRGGEDERALSLSARERRLLEEAADALARAAEHVRSRGVEELGAEELRLASEALGRIVGAIDVDEVYGEIFSRFCIGK